MDKIKKWRPMQTPTLPPSRGDYTPIFLVSFEIPFSPFLDGVTLHRDPLFAAYYYYYHHHHRWWW
jgi:hypothetical protein